MTDDQETLAATTDKPPFRRALYDAEIRAHYADNADDPFLFRELRRNKNVRLQTFSELVLSTQAITQHLNSIFLFIGVFLRIHDESLDPATLLSVTTVIAVIGWLFWERREASRRQYRSYAVPASATLALILVLLSPILKTLTHATTSDTITSLTTTLFAINALLADYRTPKASDQDSFPGAMSLNAAISASTVLASRLSAPRDAHARVFSLLLFAFVWFALAPALRTDLRVCETAGDH